VSNRKGVITRFRYPEVHGGAGISYVAREVAAACECTKSAGVPNNWEFEFNGLRVIVRKWDTPEKIVKRYWRLWRQRKRKDMKVGVWS